MKYLSIASVISKSAITPFLSGRMTEILLGALSSMALATFPTAFPFKRTLFVPGLTATTEGSDSTIPWPGMQTSVFAVPRSIPMSVETKPSTKSNGCIIFLTPKIALILHQERVIKRISCPVFFYREVSRMLSNSSQVVLFFIVSV